MNKEDSTSGRYYSISVVSRMLGIHQQTIRIYEKEGLIKPARTDGNTRLFSEEDIDDLRFILRLTNDLGVNLAGVGVVLELRRQMEDMEERFQNHIQALFEEFSRQLDQFVRTGSNLPARSLRADLIIQPKRNIKASFTIRKRHRDDGTP